MKRQWDDNVGKKKDRREKEDGPVACSCRSLYSADVVTELHPKHVSSSPKIFVLHRHDSAREAGKKGAKRQVNTVCHLSCRLQS